MAVAARALCPVLAGRDAELSALEDALLKARRGEGGVVILGGEAGMGKTRLAAELSRRAQRLGCVVMAGGCTEAEVTLPYLPFLEAIGNQLTRGDTRAVVDALGPAASELAQLFPQLGVSPTTNGDPVHAKLRLFEAILLLLTHAATTNGLLLVLEDLHWADPATRELLDYLTRRLRATNVLTLATYRSDEMHRKHALLPTIQGWRRAGSVEVVDLDPLPDHSIETMLCAIFDEQEISPELIDFLRRRTEGNPFVIEEMLKEAIDRGDIFRTDSGWDRKDIHELRVPETVRDGILLRLERLPVEDGQVLSAAAVIGRSFDVPLVAATAQVMPDVALDSLQRCVLHQLLEEDDGNAGSYRFRHALTREAIYEDMVTPRRQQLHSRVADALAGQDRPAAELAHHLLLARRDADAVELCRRAAEDAFASLAFGDGAALLERAAPLIAAPKERGQVLHRAADARWNNQESAAARRLAEESVSALESAGELAEAARARLLLGRCHWELHRSDLAEREFERAKDVLAPLGPSEDLAVAYVRLAGIPMFNWDHRKALELSRRAEQVARESGAERALSWSWTFAGGSLVHMGEIGSGFDYMERAYELAVERRFWFQAGNACFNALWSAVHLGLGRRARYFQERILGIPPGWTDLWRGWAAAHVGTHQGRLLDSLDAVRACRQQAEEAGHAKQVWRCRVAEAELLAELDRGAEAEAVLPPESTRVDRQDVIYDGTARLRTALALGDRQRALAIATNLDSAASGVIAPLDAAAEVLIELDPAAIPALVERLRLSAETARVPRARTLAGLSRLAEGDGEGGRSELAAGIELLREDGLFLDAWHASVALARAEIAAGDREQARQRLLGVVEDAQPAQARLVQRLARELAESAGIALPLAEAPPPPTTPEPALTGERLVTVLFADVRGYTETSAAAAPADLADRIAALQRWASSAVATHHGVVDKFAGDAVMATFNVNGGTLDHAAQAVRCAREIAEKAVAAGLPVGAGIATGSAVVGRLTERANLSVLGLATNLAARLQAASAAGEVTVSEETYRRLGEELREGAEQVLLELKGFHKPVAAYRLSGARPQPRGAAGTAPGAAGS